MAQGVRQRNLFAAEDFKVVYDSFKQANFQAFDYDTIRGTLVDYIQQNYPENFNDWIQSSEFVALIETLAFLAHSLAFRVDQAGRENFLSTAERRASVLRIADFLGYTPSRHLPARGLLKITSIRTTQNVFDINGNSLKNVDVRFEDSFQNFLLVTNEVLSSTNKYGRPTDTTRIGNIKTDTYVTNTANNDNVVFNFTGEVNGQRQRFEVHGLEIDTQSNTLKETEPDPNGAFEFVYRNDGQGISSNNTGFFVGFKQGALQFTDINADRAVRNLTVDLSTRNVNNSDIWVQEINSSGEVQETWTKVDSSFGANTVFNNIRQDNRKLYTDKTVDNDNVNILFGDGVYSEIPRGVIRIWYRTGLNQSYVIDPEDFGTVSFSFNYDARDGNTYQLRVEAELQSPVDNASSQESVTSIKQNAGRVFATQDRMVTGDDYTVYPLTVSDNVKKIKAINRTYAGHSRFIKPRDPTGQYQNVDMIARDGYLYSEPTLYRTTVNLPTTLTTEQLFEQYVDEVIRNPEVVNLFYDKYEADDVSFSLESTSFEWQQISSGYQGSTGYFTRNSVIERVGETTTTALGVARPGSIVELVEDPYTSGSIGAVNSTLTILNGGSGYTSAPTVTILGTGTGATASATVVSGQVATVIVTASGVGYDNPVEVQITGGGGNGAVVKAVATSAERTWARIVAVTQDGLGIIDTSGNPTGIDTRGLGAVTLNKRIPNTARISRIFPSYNTVFSQEEKTNIIEQMANRNSFGIRFDTVTNDWIIIEAGDLPTSANDSPTNFSTSFAGNKTNANLDASWIVRVNYSSDSWQIISRRTRYVFGSENDIRYYNQNGRRRFNLETNKPERDKITVSRINSLPGGSQFPIGEDINLFAFRYYTESDGYTDDRKLIVTLADVDNDNYPDNPLAFKTIVDADSINLGTTTEDGFAYTVYDPDGSTSVTGRADLTFIWRRISESNYRIDPSLSNVIDLFVLNQNYDNSYRAWIADDRKETTRPEPPTEVELETQFASLSTKKTVSDSIVYRPAEYKIIFGQLADIELQGKFRVIKVSGVTITNNEIKTRVLDAINEFFEIDNWDFGESFYFTELAAYIHQQLQGIVSSVVIQPTQTSGQFGDLFQITPESNELFLPDVTLSDIEIVNTLNA